MWERSQKGWARLGDVGRGLRPDEGAAAGGPGVPAPVVDRLHERPA